MVCAPAWLLGLVALCIAGPATAREVLRARRGDQGRPERRRGGSEG